MYHHRKLSNQVNTLKLTKKRALDSQIGRAKENIKLNYGGPSQRQASGINQQIKALPQGIHKVWGLTNRRAIKDENITINPDWVHN